MRIVVVGGTGQIGSGVVARLRETGHDVAIASRSHGVDVVTGDGLDVALKGADAVVDASNTPAQTPEETTAFFDAVATNLLAAEEDAGVAHHVLLSITNMDRTGAGVPHYAGKRRQEEIVQGGTVPWTIVRASQFFEFGELVAGWTRQGDVVTIPPLRLQPVAARDVSTFLADTAAGPPLGIVAYAGPDEVDMPELVRRTFEAKDDAVEVVPSFEGLPFTPADAGGLLAPEGSVIAPTTFDQWLAGISRR